ncbi:hypothetical protein [Paenibacillus xanthanilyticus]|uniref:Uncharacterized protein n=1 Tax=Paenibacillus xanthanilyticus TaxID=1783531 RepID=A0ABV8KCH7_9BACL
MKVSQWFSRQNKVSGGRTKRLIRISDEVSKMLQKIVITLLIAAVLSQLALQSAPIRRWVTGVDRLEGTPFR